MNLKAILTKELMLWNNCDNLPKPARLGGCTHARLEHGEGGGPLPTGSLNSSSKASWR